MSSVTPPQSIEPSPTPEISPRSIPSLEELYALTSEPDHRVVIRGVDWAFYEQLVDSIPEGTHLRVDFDGKDVEILAPSPLHDGDKKLVGQFVEAIAQELEIPYKSAGSTAWRRLDVAAGWNPTNATFSTSLSWQGSPEPGRGDRRRSPTIPILTLASRSTSLRQRSIGPESTPL